MKTSNLSLRLTVAGMVALLGVATAYGCSSSSGGGNPGPSSHEGGTDGTASSSGGSSSGGSSSGVNEGGGQDAVVIDTGSCTSDASTCNSCYSATQAAQDPLNACAPETANCIPFTGTVPSHPTL
jgi:hypothetical protein